MKQRIETIVIAILATLTCGYVFVFHIPLGALPEEQHFGSTITTIQGTDTLSSSRSVINTNFSNLNTDKFELSDWYATTSATQLVKVGTLTTGTWNATVITPQYGGTGWGNVASGTIMYGKGTSAFGTTTAGSNGQVLKLSGGTPTWESSSVDDTLAYTWTGLHTFAAGLIGTASSTINAAFDIAARSGSALTLNGLSYIFPSSRGSNETVLSENGSGTLSFSDVTTLGAGAFLVGSTTDTSVNDTTTETAFASGTSTIILLPASLLGSTGALQVRVYITTDSDSGNNNRPLFRLKYNGTTVCTGGISSGAANQGTGELVMTAYNTSASAQVCQTRSTLGTSGEAYNETTATVDTSQPIYLTLTAQWDGNDPGDTENLTIGGVNVTYLGR